MFEHFGLKDVFVALWQQKVKIICLMIVGMVLCLLFGAYQKEDNAVTASNYSMSETFYFNSITYDEGQPIYEDPVELYGQHVAINFADYFVTKASRNEIAKKVSSELGKKITTKDLEEIATCKLSSDRYILTVTASAKSEDIIRSVLKAYEQQFKDSYTQWFGKDSDGVNVLGFSEMVLEEKVAPSLNVAKYAVVGIVIGAVLGCILVFFIALFKPTINRKSDFAIYEIPVLGKIAIKKDGGK